MSSAVHAAAPALSDYRSALAPVIENTIAPAAGEVDRTGAYPRPALDALGAAGILGLLSSTEVGGMGGSLADAADVVEQVATAA
jgi:isovaleryl-CoA dehydrogenase